MNSRWLGHSHRTSHSWQPATKNVRCALAYSRPRSLASPLSALTAPTGRHKPILRDPMRRPAGVLRGSNCYTSAGSCPVLPGSAFLAISAGELRFWSFFLPAKLPNWPRTWRRTWPNVVRLQLRTIPSGWCRNSACPTYSKKFLRAPPDSAGRTSSAGTRGGSSAGTSAGN